jgi:VWFA-related protein
MQQIAASILLATASVAAFAQTPEQTPTFRTGVDVVTIEVGVADSKGRPVRDLTAAEFIVKVDGKPRRVVSAQHVQFDVDAAKREAAAAHDDESFATTNIGPPIGRLILIAVDQTNIRPGAVRPLLNTAAKFLDRLSPADQVAFVVYPPPGPEIGFTTDRFRIRQAMQQVVGNQQTFPGKFNIGLTEAIAIAERQDDMMLRVVVNRECGVQVKPQTPTQTPNDTCPREVQSEAADRVAHARNESTISLQGLRNLLRRLALIDGQKSVILLSEGLIVDEGSRTLEDIARLSAMARASLNIMLMDVSRVDMTQTYLPPTPGPDRALEMKGLEDMAAMARGVLVQVFGNGDAAFERLASELSGYYVLGVEESPSDRVGDNHRLDVSLRRKGLMLRSHQAFVLSSAARQARKPEESLIEALNSPFAVAELPLRVTNFSFQEPGNAKKVRVIIPVEIGQAGTAPADFTVGYVMFDDQGRVASSATEKKHLTPVDGREDVPLAYVIAAVVDPGTYVLRFGVVDDQGRRASVVRDVRAWKTLDEEFASGDLLLGNVADGQRTLQPQVEPRIDNNRLAAYLELYAATPSTLNTASVSIEIADDQDSAPLMTVPGELMAGARASTKAVQAAVDTSVLPPGRYVARARIMRDGKPAGALVRPFVLSPSSSASSDVASLGRLVAWLPKFERDSVLDPHVVGTMLDLVQRGSMSLTGAVQEARAGRYGPAALEALSAGDQTSAMFLRGLDFLVKGRLDEAATQFNNASGPRREFFPAAFYLGACFAIAGRDRDAAGVWQLALMGDRKPGLAYALFADARLRSGQPASVIDVLAAVHRQDPNDDDLSKRLAVAYVLTGRYGEAIPLLDDYLSRHGSDQDALYSAVVSHYQQSLRAKVPLASDTRAKLARYTKAYTGSDKALLSKYLAALDAK